MRKNKTLFFAMILLSSQWSIAQTAVSSAASLDNTNNMSLEWTLGEVAVGSAIYDSEMITIGYNQPVLKVFTVQDKLYDSKHKFSISPNPVISTLNFTSFSLENSNIKIQLTDLTGKFIALINAKTNDSKSIEMGQLISGTYLLTVKDINGEVLQSFRIVKTQ